MLDVEKKLEEELNKVDKKPAEEKENVYTIEMHKEHDSLATLEMTLHSKRIIFKRVATSLDQNKNVSYYEDLHWDMPTKQIGAIKVQKTKTNILPIDILRILIFGLITLMCIFAYVVEFINNPNNSGIHLMLMGCTSLLLLTNIFVMFPVFSKLKRKSFLCLYVETTKNENSLLLGDPSQDDGYKIEDTKENYEKLLEIAEKISNVRK